MNKPYQSITIYTNHIINSSQQLALLLIVVNLIHKNH